MLRKIAIALECNLAEIAGTTNEVIHEEIRHEEAVDSYIKWLRGVHIMLTTPNYEDDDGKEKAAIIVDIDGVPLDIADKIEDIMQMSKEHIYGNPVRHFSEGLAAVAKGENVSFGFINTNGDVIIPFKYAAVDFFSEGLCFVKNHESYGGERGFIDGNGEMVIALGAEYTHREYRPFYYNEPYFSEGLFAINDGDKFGFINKVGELVIPFEYNYAGDFSEGLAYVIKDEKQGFINTTGEMTINLEYKIVRNFSEGLAAVEKDGLWGFIDKKGKVVIPFIYSNAESFSGGLALVKRDSVYIFIDKTGMDVVRFGRNDIVSSFSEDLTFVTRYNIWGNNGKVGILEITR